MEVSEGLGRGRDLCVSNGAMNMEEATEVLLERQSLVRCWKGPVIISFYSTTFFNAWEFVYSRAIRANSRCYRNYRETRFNGSGLQCGDESRMVTVLYKWNATTAKPAIVLQTDSFSPSECKQVRTLIESLTGLVFRISNSFDACA